MISSRSLFCYLIFKILVQGQEHIVSSLKALEESHLLRLKYCILPLIQVKKNHNGFTSFSGKSSYKSQRKMYSEYKNDQGTFCWPKYALTNS